MTATSTATIGATQIHSGPIANSSSFPPRTRSSHIAASPDREAICSVYRCQQRRGNADVRGILGDRDIEVIPGDGPEIQVKAYGRVVDVKITDKPR
jgi:hypothetical protein